MGKIIEFSSICRACAKNTSLSILYSIYNSSEDTNASTDVLGMMIAISKTNLTPNDGLPDKICEKCLQTLKNAYEFQEMCQKSYEKLKCCLTTTIETKIDKESTSTPEDVQDEEECDIKMDLVNEFETSNRDADSETLNNVSESSHHQLELDETVAGPTDDNTGKNFNNSSNSIETPSTRKKLNKNYTCTTCGKCFYRKYNLRRHSNIHKTKSRPFECNVCKKGFTRESNLNRHRIVHTEMMAVQMSYLAANKSDEIFKCSECSKEFTKSNSLASHMKTHKDAINSRATIRKFTCDVCQKIFERSSSLRRHKKSHDESKKLKCTLCDKTFALSARLIDHMNRHNGLKPHVCHICNKGFQQSCTLKDHLRTHSGEQPFLCSECGKAFNNASNLRQHLIRHTGIKPFQCSECPSRFTSKGSLTSHMVTHSKVKPYVCDICGSSFTKPYSLLKHKRIHTGEKPYSCEVCDMRFYSSDHVKRHMRTHTGEKPYSCEFCDRAFAQSNDLVKHVRSHVGEKTYQCHECPKAFRLHAELREHTREHFKQKKLYDNNDSNNSVDEKYEDRHNVCKIDTGENFYECQNCSLILKSMYDLNRHDCQQQNQQHLNEVSTEENEIVELSHGQNSNDEIKNFDTAVSQSKNEKEQHQCEHCSLVFVNMNDFIAHVEIVHCKLENNEVAM